MTWRGVYRLSFAVPGLLAALFGLLPGVTWAFGFSGGSESASGSASLSRAEPRNVSALEPQRDSRSGFGFGMGSRAEPKARRPDSPNTSQIGADSVQPGPASQNVAANREPPRVEVEIGRGKYFVQQAVLYSVRVISAGNIKTFTVEFPKLSQFQADTLVFAKTRDHWEGSRRGYVTEYVYALTPMKAGHFTIPPPRVTGRFVADSNAAAVAHDFQVTGSGVEVEVLPSEAGVSPWLVAHFVRARAEFSKTQSIEIGEPVTLTVTLEGEGVSASQLPSVADELLPEGAKIYRESSEIETTLGPGPKSLTGKRVERFTLIPVQSGDIALSELPLPWWNTGRQRADKSTLRFAKLNVTGVAAGAAPESLQQPAIPEQSTPVAAILLIGLLIAAPYALYWLSKFAKLPDRLPHALSKLQAPLDRLKKARAAEQPSTGVRLSPAYHARSLYQRFVQLLPTPHKIWYCVRRIEIEDDPADWCQLFQLYATKYLDIPVNSPIGQIADKLIETNPRIKADRMLSLVDEIEGCKYGGTSIEFESWKRRFRDTTRPPLLPWRWIRRKSRSELPDLNPRRPV